MIIDGIIIAAVGLYCVRLLYKAYVNKKNGTGGCAGCHSGGCSSCHTSETEKTH